MNFFQYQDRSRRNTTVLIVLFVIAVILIIAAIYFSLVVPVYLFYRRTYSHLYVGPLSWWNPALFWWVTGGTILVVFAGALYMHSKLSGGGASLAALVGGIPASAKKGDAAVMRLRNVVEEMAIASGTPVPEVYVLPAEGGINAFAAGYSPSDAVVGVTQGTLNLLTREELQGVIAHEFSHILNGDIRLNIRLTSVLHGILCIATIGYWTLRSMRGTSDRKGGVAAIAMVGLMLLVIGYIGVFFGRLIKSSISRQREFLADASAVQFTRNPLGIAGALKKIGGYTVGSKIQNHNAETVSHIFFGNGIRETFFGWLATHPPLNERIKRIDPSFDGKLSKIEKVSGNFFEEEEAKARGVSFLESPAKIDVSPAQIVMQVGNPETKHLEYAGAFLTSLPADLVLAAHETDGAKAVVFALLLAAKDPVRADQLKFVQTDESTGMKDAVLRLAPMVEKVGSRGRLPLLDLCIPALRKLPLNRVKHLFALLKKIVYADQKMELHEFVIIKLVGHHLRPLQPHGRRGTIKYRSFEPLESHAQVLLSVLANYGQASPADALPAFKKGWSRLSRKDVAPVSTAGTGMESFHRALSEFETASPSLKQDLIEAFTAAIAYDGKVTTEEGELIRMVGAALDCPIPPLMQS